MKMKELEKELEKQINFEKVAALSYLRNDTYKVKTRNIEIEFSMSSGGNLCVTVGGKKMIGGDSNHWTLPEKTPKELFKNAFNGFKQGLIQREKDRIQKKELGLIDRWYKSIAGQAKISRIPREIRKIAKKKQPVYKSILIEILKGIPTNLPYIRVECLDISGHLVKIKGADSQYHFWESTEDLSSSFSMDWNEDREEYDRITRSYYLIADGTAMIKTEVNGIVTSQTSYPPGEYELCWYGKFACYQGNWFIVPLTKDVELAMAS